MARTSSASDAGDGPEVESATPNNLSQGNKPEKKNACNTPIHLMRGQQKQKHILTRQ
jgi:hypothetical protein